MAAQNWSMVGAKWTQVGALLAIVAILVAVLALLIQYEGSKSTQSSINTTTGSQSPIINGNNNDLSK